MGKYVEIAVGNPHNRNQIIPIRALPRVFGKSNAYRSYYTFDENRLTHTRRGGTTRQYKGALSCFLGHVWDIDFASDPGKAAESAKKLVSKLEYFSVPEHMIRIYFSGKKGFHVCIPDLFGFEEGELIYGSVKETMKAFWPDCDESIYTRTGLVRIQNTQHGYSGRYKIPVRISDLSESKMGLILELSTNPDLAQTRVEHSTILQGEIEPLLAEMVVEKEVRPITASAYAEGEEEDIPDYLTCMWHLQRDGIEEGFRHEALMRLAASYHHRAIPEEAAASMLLEWAKMISEGTSKAVGEKEVLDALRWAYSRNNQRKFRCDDTIMQRTCDPHCKLFDRMEEIGSGLSMENLAQQYIHEQAEKRTAFTMDEIGWKGIGYMVQAREIVLISGDTKLGKSSLVWNWMSKLRHLKIYYFGPELNPTHIFVKLIQIKYGIRMKLDEEINEMPKIIKDGSLVEMAKGLDHIVIDTRSPSLENLETILKEERPDMIVLDPFESLHSTKNRDITEARMTDEFRQLVNTHGVIAICIQHINKAGQRENKGGTKLDLWMIKGWKRIQEQADHILLFEGSPSTNMRNVRSELSRNPQDLNVDLSGDPYTHRFYLNNVNKL